MFEVWIKTAGVIVIIAIGYLLKKTKFLPADSAKLLSRLSLNVMLPFVYISNLNGLTISKDLVNALLWGFAIDAVLTAAAFLLAWKKPKETVFIMQYCVPGFNTTGYALPVLQMFASEYEVASLVLFNIPISLFFFIVTPLLVDVLGAGEEKFSLKAVGHTMIRNVAAMSALLMLLLCLLHIKLPEELITAFRPLANANAAVALLTMGLLFEFPRGLPKENLKALAVRLAITISAALLVWFDVIPFGPIKNAMIIVLLAPIPNGSPSLALYHGYEGDKVAFGVSLNMIISVAAVSLLCAVLF